MMFNIIIIRI